MLFSKNILVYLPTFLVPSNDGFRSFDIFIVAIDIKGARAGVNKVNVKLMLTVAVLPDSASV